MIRSSDVLTHEVDAGTLGGDTHWIETTKWQGELHAVCFRPVRNKETGAGGRCSNVAGYGTDHVGTGACKFHGGDTLKNVAISHGQYAYKTRMALKDRIDAYVDGPDSKKLYDLTYELAAMRVLFQQTINQFPEEGSEDYERNFGISARRAMEMIQATGSLVDKISRIESRNALTAAQVLYLRTRLADILVRYIKDPELRQRAIEDLALAIPGGVNDTDHQVKALPG